MVMTSQPSFPLSFSFWSRAAHDHDPFSFSLSHIYNYPSPSQLKKEETTHPHIIPFRSSFLRG
ncbi:hypothetical protein RchiOBHm_Chr2g0154861 [Rosa chinensis]|uniref:Uncharacterized protein n=1 Tax=Rosa chinensis TaxID=74649 RepID=A0A2P6S127_ROSCH|nr:hypothetical protein RchiOBHm_Chr2g0154861 [Rosa chinensis]